MLRDPAMITFMCVSVVLSNLWGHDRAGNDRNRYRDMRRRSQLPANNSYGRCKTAKPSNRRGCRWKSQERSVAWQRSPCGGLNGFTQSAGTSDAAFDRLAEDGFSGNEVQPAETTFSGYRIALVRHACDAGIQEFARQDR